MTLPEPLRGAHSLAVPTFSRGNRWPLGLPHSSHSHHRGTNDSRASYEDTLSPAGAGALKPSCEVQEDLLARLPDIPFQRI